MRDSGRNIYQNTDRYNFDNGQSPNASERVPVRNYRAGRVAWKRTALFFLTICAVVFFFLTAGVLHSRAGSDQEHKFKYYTRITIEEGDTLWSIADQYMDKSIQDRNAYIEEVKSINHIHDRNRIIAGMMLIVPYYSTEYIAD